MHHIVRLIALGLIESLLACGSSFANEAGSMGSQTDSTSARNFSGVWWAAAYYHELRPVKGEAVPFTPAGRTLYQEVQANLRSGKLVDNTRHTCLPQGTPRVMTTAYPFLVLQTSGQVSMLFEENRVYRTIRLNAKPQDPETWDPSFMGESVGRWRGQTLLINTTNFKTVTFLDDAGLPHSDQLEVNERLSKTSDGKGLVDLITITDPAIYMKPWTARLVFESHPEVQISTDWVCGEPHRNISAVAAARP